MKTGRLLALMTIVVLLSCKKVYKSDSDYPDLPAYSEKGLDTWGILINDNPWLTSEPRLFAPQHPLQLRSYPAGDSIVITFKGHYKDTSLQYQDPVSLFVVIKNVKIMTDNDLVQLNGQRYDLDGTINYGGFSDWNGNTWKAVGNITFGKVSENSKITYGNGDPGNPVLHPYIVAGRLNMSVSTATTNYTLREGRFDVDLLRNYQFTVN